MLRAFIGAPLNPCWTNCFNLLVISVDLYWNTTAEVCCDVQCRTVGRWASPVLRGVAETWMCEYVSFLRSFLSEILTASVHNTIHGGRTARLCGLLSWGNAPLGIANSRHRPQWHSISAGHTQLFNTIIISFQKFTSEPFMTYCYMAPSSNYLLIYVVFSRQPYPTRQI